MAAISNDSKPAALHAPIAASQMREDPRIRLVQLSRLHDEAAKIAVLANLLGRAPRMMAALVLGALGVAAMSFNAMPTAEVVVWLALTAAGITAMWRAYARAISAPFELFALRGFADDLSAIAFYAGFAWGAGAFLALAPQDNVAAIALFAAVPCALVAVLLRSPVQTMLFLAPVSVLATLAALIRPLGGIEAAGLVVAACGAIAGLSYWMERVSAPEPAPQLAGLAVR